MVVIVAVLSIVGYALGWKFNKWINFNALDLKDRPNNCTKFFELQSN